MLNEQPAANTNTKLHYGPSFSATMRLRCCLWRQRRHRTPLKLDRLLCALFFIQQKLQLRNTIYQPSSNLSSNNCHLIYYQPPPTNCQLYSSVICHLTTVISTLKKRQRHLTAAPRFFPPFQHISYTAIASIAATALLPFSIAANISNTLSLQPAIRNTSSRSTFNGVVP